MECTLNYGLYSVNPDGSAVLQVEVSDGIMLDDASEQQDKSACIQGVIECM